MDRLPTRVNRADPDFAARKSHNSRWSSNCVPASTPLRRAVVESTLSATVQEESTWRGSELTASSTQEPLFGTLTACAYELYDGRAHSAGIVTGIGMVHGRECLFVANDAHGQGRVLLPHDGQKAHSSADRGSRKPSSVHLPR